MQQELSSAGTSETFQSVCGLGQYDFENQFFPALDIHHVLSPNSSMTSFGEGTVQQGVKDQPVRGGGVGGFPHRLLCSTTGAPLDIGMNTAEYHIDSQLRSELEPSDGSGGRSDRTPVNEWFDTSVVSARQRQWATRPELVSRTWPRQLESSLFKTLSGFQPGAGRTEANHPIPHGILRRTCTPDHHCKCIGQSAINGLSKNLPR